MRFVLKRLALFVVALFGLSVVVFAALRILPGDVASVMAGVNSPPERVTQLREQLGLNRPLIAQYFDWMSALARGDFGTSIRYWLLCNLLGRRTCVHHLSPDYSWPAHRLGHRLAAGLCGGTGRSATVRAVFHVLAIVGGAVPALWGGLLLILLFGRGVGLLDVFPSQGFPLDGWGAPGSAISALVLPAVSVGIIGGSIAYAIHARGLRGFSQFRLHRYGMLVWHDAHSGGVACGIAVGNPAAGVCYRADLRFDGHWRDGHRKPVCVTGHRQRSCDRLSLTAT